MKLRGWEVVRLREGELEVDLVPEKGGDIIAVRHRGENLLFESPWGLRARAEPPAGTTSLERWLEMYPGGWQTIFPNGGDGSEGFGFHGEACLVPYAYIDGVLRATLSSVPAVVTRAVSLHDGALHVEETITNAGGEPFEAMWSHHPAFALGWVDRVECGARGFVVDDARDTPAGDLVVGAVSDWPFAPARDGGIADLRELPARGDRFGTCTGFTDGWATITGGGRRVRLEWDASMFPHAWYWLEAGATTGYPWFGRARVFAIEPASSWPGQGIAAARAKGAGPLRWAPGESKTARVTMRVE